LLGQLAAKFKSARQDNVPLVSLSSRGATVDDMSATRNRNGSQNGILRDCGAKWMCNAHTGNWEHHSPEGSVRGSNGAVALCRAVAQLHGFSGDVRPSPPPIAASEQGEDTVYPSNCVQLCNHRYSRLFRLPSIPRTRLRILPFSQQYRRPDSCLRAQGKNREGPGRNCSRLPDAAQTLVLIFELFEISSRL